MMIDDNKYDKKKSSSFTSAAVVSSSAKKEIIEKCQQNKLQQFLLVGIIIIIILFVAVTQVFQGTTNPPPSSYSNSNNNNSTYGIQRILYCMTTLSEYDNGKRSTTKGYDRLEKTVLPILKESVQSMLQSNFEVDVVLICGYKMTRQYLIFESIPQNVGLQIWDDATPLGYKLEDTTNSNYTIQQITRGLARQHRYIIKDKLPYYDFFVNFEDDMLITGPTITNYIEITHELEILRQKAPLTGSEQSRNPSMFYGPLSQKQLSRMIPGFIRVEVLIDETNYGAQEKLDPVPVTDRPQLDPASCCHLSDDATTGAISDNVRRPGHPDSDQLFTWETNIKALGVRKMPLQSQNLEWVLFQRGPRMKEPQSRIGDYWSGRDKYFGSDFQRPDTKSFKYINNQGGWMATRTQIWDWHTQICPGGFLPPYDPGDYNLDGLDMRNVEYWSGGMSLVTKEHGCNLQRIISLDEIKFAKSLLYHTANNKQRQLHGRRQMFVKINDLYGQLTTVVNNAKHEMNRRVQAINDVLHHT